MLVDGARYQDRRLNHNGGLLYSGFILIRESNKFLAVLEDRFSGHQVGFLGKYSLDKLARDMRILFMRLINSGSEATKV